MSAPNQHAILRQATINQLGNGRSNLSGIIHADSADRFPDGLYITTTRIVAACVDGTTFDTEHTRYTVESWAE